MSTHTDILLESGTNELEILEFMLEGKRYGINVSKVKEIMKACPVNAMQKSHPDVEGVFKPRDEVITVVNLAHHLKLAPSKNPEQDIFIITNFSEETYAFHVHEVVGINRISWNKLQKPDEIIYGGEDGVATAIAEFQGRLITILDFEKIISEICPNVGIQLDDLESLGPRGTTMHPILTVEDSMLLGRMVVEGLERAGYGNITRAKNGQEAWDYLLSCAADTSVPVTEHVACIITDIEMPLMDGHHLIKLIKGHPRLKDIPVVIFSSLINDQLIAAGKELGASGQFAKPHIAEMIRFVDEVSAGTNA